MVKALSILFAFLFMETTTSCTIQENFTIKSLKVYSHSVNADKPILERIAVAQAILESGLQDGVPSKLAKDYNNLFGITCAKTGVKMKTHEYSKGTKVLTKRPFCKFKSLKDSFIRHRELMEKGIKSNPKIYRKVYNATTIEQAAKELQKAGYATDPKYSQKLIKTVKEFKL